MDDAIQQQLTNHEQRLIRLEDWTHAAKDQLNQQQNQSDQITTRIDHSLDQIGRLQRSMLTIGGSLVVALIGVILTLLLKG